MLKEKRVYNTIPLSRADPTIPSLPPNLAPLAPSSPVCRPTDAPFVLREDQKNLVDAYNKLERTRIIEDGFLSWARAVESTKKARVAQVSGDP